MYLFFQQMSAYELRISDWSSDVCSSDLPKRRDAQKHLTDAGLKLAYRAPHDHGDREYWSNPAGDRFGDHSATITPLKVEGKISFFVAEFDPEPETNGS